MTNFEQTVIESLNNAVWNTLFVEADRLEENGQDELAQKLRWMAKTKRHPYVGNKNACRWYFVVLDYDNFSEINHCIPVPETGEKECVIWNGLLGRYGWTRKKWNFNQLGEAFLWAAHRLEPVNL